MGRSFANHEKWYYIAGISSHASTARLVASSTLSFQIIIASGLVLYRGTRKLLYLRRSLERVCRIPAMPPPLQAAVLEPVELDISTISLRQYVHIGSAGACCNIIELEGWFTTSYFSYSVLLSLPLSGTWHVVIVKPGYNEGNGAFCRVSLADGQLGTVVNSYISCLCQGCFRGAIQKTKNNPCLAYELPSQWDLGSLLHGLPSM